MLHLESQFQDTEGSTCYANFDMAHGYWQLSLSEDSREIHSIRTPIGVCTPIRILQGGTDSGNHFQVKIQQKLNVGGVQKFLQWIDDFLFFAVTEEELLCSIEKFLQACKKYNFKVHALKSTLFTKRDKFCGRILSQEGIEYDPRHLDALINMSNPTQASELQQLLFATNWMRKSLPNYANTIAPLHELHGRSL
eukprot:IDg14694t1